MADLVELAAEGVDRLVDSHHFDKGYDKGYDVYRKYVNGEKVESTVTPYDREKDGKRSRESNVGAQSNSKDTSEKRSSPRASQAGGASREVRSSAAGGAPPSGGPESHHPSNTTVTAAQTSSRRKQRNDLPSPERDNFASTAIPAAAVGAAAAGAYTYSNTQRNGEFERQSSISDQVLREYEREADDPTRRAEKVLSPSQLNKISRSSTVKSSNRGYRRDSAMTSRYADDYREAGSQYAGSNRPRSQPPRSRYDDDGDSDYDEKSGRRSRGTGRGYDDREYDRVIEETERYRGPVGAGPLVVRVAPYPLSMSLPLRINKTRDLLYTCATC
jgi:alkaline phosphatase